ncbi:MAG: hypothetical protein FJ104_13825 [Deltaproteobacteria bacterium]|nr:hypothetical protein [Deltaproteobacteria bacterium]
MALRISQLIALTALAGMSSVACGSTSDDGSSDDGAGAGSGGGPGGGGGGTGECTEEEAYVPGNNCFPGKADPCKDPLNSGFPGDEYCLEPPTDGYQMHVGPENYDDPAELEKWILPPGGYPVGDPRREAIGEGADINWCYFMRTPNTEDIYVGESFSRMRPGSHHYISFALPRGSELPDSTEPRDCSERDAAVAGGANFLSGATRSVQNVSMYGDAPEDKGLGSLVLANQQLSQNLHFVNIGDEEVLQEIWVNTTRVPTESVTDKVRAMTWIGGVGMNIPYGAHQLVENTPCDAPADIPQARMLGVTAHAHANTLRVSMYQIGADGTKTPIFDEFNWTEPTVWRFSSSVTNPTPDLATSKSGADLSGLFYAKPGDKFGWECEVINKSPDKNNLVFSDKAYSGEMCNVFGMYSSPLAERPWSCYSLAGGKDI